MSVLRLEVFILVHLISYWGSNVLGGRHEMVAHFINVQAPTYDRQSLFMKQHRSDRLSRKLHKSHRGYIATNIY